MANLNIGCFMVILLIIAVFSVGCVDNSPAVSTGPTLSPTLDVKNIGKTTTQPPAVTKTTSPITQYATSTSLLSTIEPSEMALQLSDLPPGFTLKERSERVYSDVDSWAHNNGWKKGYIVSYQKVDLNALSGTVIDQRISIYPIGNISRVTPQFVNDLKNKPEGISIDELSNPNIGDSSQAFRGVASSDGSKIYFIVFYKKDVYESLSMTGKTTDYELLKDVAKIAAAKIK